MVRLSNPTFFTEEEAQSKVGKKVHCLTQFSDVPWKSPGEIIGIVNANTKDQNDFYVTIRWKLKNGETKINRFAKNAYNVFIWEDDNESQEALPYVSI